MTWFSHQDSGNDALAYKSLGLNALLGLLPVEGVLHVLDLGPALGSNVYFWSQYRCRLWIEDFFQRYSAAIAEAEGRSREELFMELLAFNPATRFDVILAWDLFNYLDVQDLQGLIRRLAEWCRPGTLLFASISSQPEIPAEPNQFRILDSERLVSETRSRETRACPRHRPSDIGKLLAGFDTSRSFLMRHGAHEYVFSYREIR